jgi:hypothetical protein
MHLEASNFSKLNISMYVSSRTNTRHGSTGLCVDPLERMASVYTNSENAIAGKLSEHFITVRVYDRHDNAGVAKTVIAAQEK